MQGTYVIKQDGLEVARSENVITLEGKKIIASYLAGIAPNWSGAIAVGASTVPALNTDVKLRLEWDREEVLTRAVIFGGGAGGTHRIIVKTTLPAEVAGRIVELGLFSLASSISASSSAALISGMFADDDWEVYDTGAWIDYTPSVDTTYSRAGTGAELLACASGSKSYRLNLGIGDYSMYGGLDKISIGAYHTSGTVSALTIKFYTDDSNYFAYSPTPSTIINASTNTYTIAVLNKSLWAATGNPSWANITSIGWDITGSSANVAVDLMRIDDTDETDPAYALVSRSILPTPVVKSAGSEMDIEYYLDV